MEPSAIKKAKEKAKKRGLTVNFLVSDVFKIQLLQKINYIREAEFETMFGALGMGSKFINTKAI